MGEIGVTSIEMEKKEIKEDSGSVVKWENILPKNGLRVLLVESDDSTRQIIGALLRKCSYKVATAPDGLKAWELLKARPQSIDLILTEMELPSISGFALLTLVMEHESCKNIPVIMMSKYDTVSVVYKCMMRGAADFLVKPIRINELKNLWQHVWRRQAQVSRGSCGFQNDNVVEEEKIEATAENNDATSERASGSSKACAPMQEECLKKGSDAQSSCGKLDLEAESPYSTEVEDYSLPKQGLSVSPVTELRLQGGRNPSAPEGAGQDTANYNGNRALDRDQRLEEKRLAENGDKVIVTNPPREAIDLIGGFGDHSKHGLSSNEEINRRDLFPHLDLSLTGCSSVGVENKSSNDNQMLNHSNASAFTLYINKTIQASNSNANSGYSNDYENVSRKLFPIPVHPSRVHVDGCSSVPAGYGSTMPPQPVRTPSPSPSPSSVNPLINSYREFSAQQKYGLLDFSPRISSNQTVYDKQDQKVESSLEGRNQTQFSVTDVRGGSEGGNEQSNGLSRQRSLQREAALNKFRLKRKERCYDKKVRYESRKKLAEQRPRVKGQFVRQVPPDTPPPSSNHSGPISVAI